MIDPEFLAAARANMEEMGDMPRSAELFDLMIRVAELGDRMGDASWIDHSEVTRWAVAEVTLAAIMLGRCLTPIVDAEGSR